MRTGSFARAARRTSLLALAMVLAACGDATTPSGAPTAAITPEPTPVTTVYELGAKVWYEGLVLTFDRVSATLDERGGLVDVLVGVANPGADAADLSGRIVLVVGGDSGRADARFQHPGSARRGQRRRGADVRAPGDSVGRRRDHRDRREPGARCPRADDARTPGRSSTSNRGRWRWRARRRRQTSRSPFAAGLLRSDLPDWWQELGAKLEALTLTYDVTYTGDFAGGLAFTGENVALRLPDGTVIAARRDGHSQSVELIGSRKTKKGLFSRFEIPTGLTGSFALLVRNSGTERTIKFTIGG